jgi:ribosomal protein L4
MNKERRKAIESALATLAKARELVEEAQSTLEEARDEERDYFDNMPESLQSGEKGERASAAADALEEACNAVEDITAAFDDIESNCETASE